MEINGKTKQPPKMNKNYKNMFEFLQSHKYDKNLHLNGPTHTRIGDRDADIYGGSYYVPE